MPKTGAAERPKPGGVGGHTLSPRFILTIPNMYPSQCLEQASTAGKKLTPIRFFFVSPPERADVSKDLSCVYTFSKCCNSAPGTARTLGVAPIDRACPTTPSAAPQRPPPKPAPPPLLVGAISENYFNFRRETVIKTRRKSWL